MNNNINEVIKLNNCKYWMYDNVDEARDVS